MSRELEKKPSSLRELVRRHERLVILETLRRNQFSRERTAEILDLSLPTLWRKMKSLGITRAEAPVTQPQVSKNFIVDSANLKK